MIWVGFGFLMTFLKRYGQSAVGLTFLVGAVLVQVALICNGVTVTLTGAKAHLSLERSVPWVYHVPLRRFAIDRQTCTLATAIIAQCSTVLRVVARWT